MKERIIIILNIAAVTLGCLGIATVTTCWLFAADMEVPLDNPVTVTKTTVVEEQSSSVKVKYIVLDMQNKRIEVEFVGVNKRLVRQLTDAQFNAFRTSFISAYGTILKGMIVEHFTPAPTPTPTPE